MNQTIAFGNITTPVVSKIAVVDAASGGLLTIMIHAIIFLLILGAFYKKYNNFEKGLVAAGWVTGILSAMFTIIAQLPWNYIWISVTLFLMAFIVKGFDKE